MVVLKDHYKILGIQRSANDDEIKKAYRNLAKQYHPDKNKAKEAEERFKEISAAYDVLKDVDKKKVYDMQLLGEEERANRFRPSYASQTFTSRPGNFETSWGFGSGDNDDFFTNSSFSFTSPPRASGNERDGTRKKKANRRSYGPEYPTWSYGWADESMDADTQAFFRAFGNQGGNQFSFIFGNVNRNLFSDFDDVFKGFFDNDGSSHMGMGSMFNDPFFEMHSARNAFSFENVFSDVPSYGHRGARQHAQSKPKQTRSTWDDWSQPVFKERPNDFKFHADKETEDATLLPCSYCGRNFSMSTLGRHEVTCEKRNAKNSSRRPESGTESPLNLERRRKREEFVRNLCNMRTSREDSSTGLFSQSRPEPRPASTERQSFGGSSRTNSRRSADRRDRQPRSARTPGTRSRLSESDSSDGDDEAGTGGIFYKAQTARSSSSRPHTASRHRPQANSRKTENSSPFLSSSYIPSRFSQKDKASNGSSARATPTFSARPKVDVRS